MLDYYVLNHEKCDHSIMSENFHPTVLIIDDSAVMRDVTSDMLQLIDLNVLTAANGEEGVTVFRQNGVDLVLLDMNMPYLDGAATYQALLEIDADVLVIVCTSDSKSKVKLRFGDLKMPSYLHKPFDTTVLLDTVQAMLP
ncbi:MAG: response regulator [Chloroflexi bacterium]|nr:MAG: response regulator [Chloroflexota bacterium]